MARNVEVVVGVVGRPHGIAGELGIAVRSDEPTIRFATGAVLHADGEPHRTWQVLGHRWHQDRLLLRLEGISDRNAAEAMRGVRLAVSVPAGARPDDEAEYYDHQLIGLAVADHTGRRVGEVTAVEHLPVNDLLRVRVTDTAEDRLVPFVAALVPEVDLATGVVTLADVPGLLVDEPDPDEDAGR